MFGYVNSNNKLEPKIKEGLSGIEGEGETFEVDRMFKFKLYRKEFNYNIVIKKERDRVKKQ